MNEWLRWVVGGLGGFYSSRWRASYDRRQAFLSQIAVWIAQLRDTPNEALIGFHETTKTEVRDACARISTDIRGYRQGELTQAGKQYYALTKDDIVSDPIGDALRPRTGNYNPITPLAEFPGRGRMCGLLRKAIDLA